MEKFTWSEDYSVGILSLDEQHKQFFLITNGLIDLISEKKVTKENLSLKVQEMASHALNHLKTEEDYFDTLHYPEAIQHIKAHNLFRGRIDHFVAMLEDEKTDLNQVADKIATYAIYWLSDHILIMDKQYTVFLRDRGIK